MKIRRANVEDIEKVINNRVEFLSLIREIEDEKSLKVSLREYLNKHIDDGTLIIYIGVVDEKIVSSAILSIYERIPTATCLTGKMGTLLNVYTLKECRRRGYSKEILKVLLNEAKEEGVIRVQLDYTDDGYELYKELGFKCLNSEMALVL